MQIEKELWLRVSNDDQLAYAEVFRLLYNRLYNYGKKFTDQDAILEDSLQDTLLSIWTKRDALPTIEYPTTYYFSTFRYILLGKIKAGSRMVLSGHEEDGPEFGVDHMIVQRETDDATRQQITNALAGLTARQREAIFLRFYEGMSYDQVAETMNITVKAAYKIMARALTELRQMLEVSGAVLAVLLRISFQK